MDLQKLKWTREPNSYDASGKKIIIITEPHDI